MLYLIGGPQRSGKSTLARRLQRSTGTNVVSTDAIVWMLQTKVPDLGVVFPIFPENADAVAPFVAAFVEAQHGWAGQDLAVEGVAVMPRHVEELVRAARAEDGWRAVFLGHEGATAESIGIGGGWAADGDASKRELWARMTREPSFAIRDECAASGLPYFDVTGRWDEALTEALVALLA